MIFTASAVTWASSHLVSVGRKTCETVPGLQSAANFCLPATIAVT